MKKKLTILFLQLSLVLMGVSILVDTADATMKNGERAMELLRQARAAIGGDNAVKNVENLSLKGKSRRVLKIKNQADKEINSDYEMAVLLPNQIFKMERIGLHGDGSNTFKFEIEDNDEVEEKVVEIRTDKDGRTDDSFKVARTNTDNEIYRFMLGFLLTPPKDANLTYDYTGEETVDGQTANVISVNSNGNAVMRLYLDKQSNLPLMMSYKGQVRHAHPEVMEWNDKANGKINTGDKDVIIFRDSNGNVSRELPDKIMLERKANGDAANKDGKFNVFVREPASAEIQVKFSDYRDVGGLRLPFQITEIVNGTVDQTIAVDSYEINVPNMAERFKPHKVQIRVKRPQ